MNVPATRHPRKIGTYCDIDTRRYMGHKPGKIKIPTYIKLPNYKNL